MLLLAALASLAHPVPWATTPVNGDFFEQAYPLDGQLFGRSGAASGDLNGDGLEDVIVFNAPSVRVLVSLADGQGSFGRPTLECHLPGTADILVSFGENVHTAVADLDGDGNLDLAFATSTTFESTAKIWSARGDGEGGFDSPRLHWRFDSDVRSFVIADVNADGFPDAVVGGLNLGFIYAPGTANGLANEARPLINGGASAKLVTAGDFDGDGFVDLVAGLREGMFATRLRCYYGDGTGEYLVQRSFYLGDIVDDRSALLSDDMDGDGLDDVVVVDREGARMRVYQSRSGRTLTEEMRVVDFSQSSILRLLDVNADGLPDILRNGGTTWVTRNLGSFSFGAPTPGGTSFGAVATFLNIDQDGIPDAVGYVSPDGLAPWTGTIVAANGDYRMVQAGPAFEEGFASPAVARPLDANRDGFDDFLICANDQVQLKLAIGDGQFLPAEVVVAEDCGPGLGAVGDVTNDGIEDIVVYVESRGRFEFAEGDGQGGFAPAAPLFPFSLPVESMELQDLDGDGFDDLLWNRQFQVPSAYYAFGSPGGFSSPGLVSLPLTPVRRRGTDDFNGDGLEDLLISYFGEIAISIQEPGQTFGPPQVIHDNGADLNEGATSGDVDGDGIIDVVFAPDAGSIFWLRGLGGAAFGAVELLVDEPVDSELQLKDVDLDGDQDLFWVRIDDVLTFYPQYDILWAENLGAGVFSPAMSADPNPMVINVDSIVFLDGDGDGDPDMLSSVSQGNFTDSVSGALVYSTNATISARGEDVCSPVVPNSTGWPGDLTAVGSLSLGLNSMRLVASELPVGAAGFFLCSQDSGMNQNVPGSVGTLCLSGAIGRFVGPGEIMQASAAGTFALDLDLTAIPTPNMGRIPVILGETWVFQAWHRDVEPGGGLTSNFTQAVAIGF